MAMQSFNGQIPFPSPYPYNSSRNLNNFIASTALNEQADLQGCVIQIPKAGNITKVGFRTAAVTTANDLQVGIFTVDATTGNPDTASAYKTMAVGTQAAPAANTWYTVTLGTQATSVVQGDVVGVIIQSADADAIDLSISLADSANWVSLVPYGVHYNNATTTWAKTVGSPIISLEYDDGSYAQIQGVLPASGLTDRAYDTVGAEEDEGGNMFQVPFKCRVVGWWFYGDVNADLTVKLYDSDGSTVLTSFAYDLQQQQGSTNGFRWGLFPASQTLSINTNYRITTLASSSTGHQMSDMTVTAAAVMDAMPGGQEVHYTSRDGGGSWAQITTRRAMIGVLIDQFDDGASTGGGSSWLSGE